MVLDSIFRAFVERTPISVMVQATIRHALNQEALDRVFTETAERQYNQELLFSTVVDLMTSVVCGVHPSVHAAYQAQQDEIGVTIRAVYDKLGRMEPGVAAGLVQYSASRLLPVIRQMGGALPKLLPGYRVRIIDGNHLAGTDRRLKELREVNGGALPGQVLCVLDPEYRLITHVHCIEDAHAQERRFLPEILRLVERRDVWVADRNFCTASFLLGIAARQGFFVIRQHQNLVWRTVGRQRRRGRIATGRVWEQDVEIRAADGQTLRARRVSVVLDQPTRDGDAEIHILTNLPPEEVSAQEVAILYAKRWTIETVFAELAKNLNGEIDTLAYPKAALFGFCVALVAANVQATVMAALRAEHGEAKIGEEFSLYYLANEIAGTYQGMMIAIPSEHWQVFEKLDAAELAQVLRNLAGKVRLQTFRKHKRGPKKTRGKKRRGKFIAHVATARLLAERKNAQTKKERVA
jgi:IS4 transposase